MSSYLDNAATSWPKPEAVYRAVGRHLKGVFPVSTGLVVSALARPEWLVEVEATAVIPD